MRIPVAACAIALLVPACTTSDAPATCSDDEHCPIGCSCVEDDSGSSSGVCRTEEGADCPDITCLGPADCPDGMYCTAGLDLVTLCERACTDATPGDGSEGTSCRFDTDCSSNECDNDFEESLCVCGGSSGDDLIPGCDTTTPAGGPGTVPPNGACDQNSDCASASCRDPAENPAEGCTCRHGDEGCPVIDVTPGTVEFMGACDDDGDCSQGFPCVDCVCI